LTTDLLWPLGQATVARRDQNARRLAEEESASGFGRVCKSPQYSTAAKSANIATMQMVTSNESIGMRLTSSNDGENMPASRNRSFDLHQMRREFPPVFLGCGHGGGAVRVQ